MAKKSFSFMLEEDLRAEAEKAAKAKLWTLGTWVSVAVEEKLARDATPQPARKKPAK